MDISITDGVVDKIDNVELEMAFNFVQYTNKNVFLTGKAGTGKTTFLHNLKKLSLKRMIVVAPTGVAAINAGGVTIHSFFQLPFGPFIPSENDGKENRQVQKFNKEKINIIKSMDLLVIDEISMVRADVLDAIDHVLRRFKNRVKPFGGIQLLMIGDIQQLAPVIKEDEWVILKEWYESVYFFSSRALMMTQYISIELKHIYRQRDIAFINLLNKVRDNNIDRDLLNELNKRYNPELAYNTPEGYIILTTHNSQAKSINERKLAQIKAKEHCFTASTQGDFPEYSYPTDNKLMLKEGAQIMFVKNDLSRDKLFYNGKIGVVKKINKESIIVECEGDEDSITVQQTEWQNFKYSINEDTEEIQEEVVGTFIQYPLKLAWAITIHKSQGLTFEKAIIDASSAFAHGQVYVALSRCKSIEGMVLGSKLTPKSIISDTTVRNFSQKIKENTPDRDEFEKSRFQYQKELIFGLFDFSEILRQLTYCLKVYNENCGSLHEALKVNVEEMISCVNRDLIMISEKFKLQINAMLEIEPDMEINVQFQERIVKAGEYYREKIKDGILKILDEIYVESDNRSVKKTIVQGLDKVKTDVLIKVACFEECKKGFNVKAFLDTRGKASIEKTNVKKNESQKQDRIQFVSKSTSYPQLFESLKKWRISKGEEFDLPVFFILNQKCLLQIVEQLPTNLKDLRKIKGIGKKKVKIFGDEIIEIVREYCEEKGIKCQ